jgi:hypothetical protein
MPILVTVVCVCVCVLKLRAKDFFFLFRVLGYVNTLFLCAHRPMQRPNRLVGLTNVRSREPQHRVARSAVHRDCPFLLGRKDNVEYLPSLLHPPLLTSSIFISASPTQLDKIRREEREEYLRRGRDAGLFF